MTDCARWHREEAPVTTSVPGSEALTFRLLGPFEVLRAGETVVVPGRRRRTLLALLVLRRNRVVSMDALIADLWGETPPDHAVATIQAHVAHLRRALGHSSAAVLESRTPGYVLHARDDQVDAATFAELAREGRAALTRDPVVAARRLEEAISLFRGPVLADLHEERGLQPEIARLDEERLSTLELRIEARLQLGEHAEVVGELQSLVRLHPWREQLTAQLMLALYRCGRQADALAAYTTTRRALVDELGIEPGPALRRFELRVLQQDPGLEWPAGGDAATAPRTPGEAFVGRSEEMARLRELVERARAGRGAGAMVVGEPGIGKTRLLEECAQAASSEGATTLWARCAQDDGAPPLWPWIQVLRGCLEHLPEEEVVDAIGAAGGVLAQLVPELSSLVHGPRLLPDVGPAAARFRLHDAVTVFLRRIATARAPLVLVLDDLHWADESSLLLLRFALRELTDAPVLLLMSRRDTESGHSAAPPASLAELADAPDIRLRPLAADDVALLIESVSGRTPGDDAVRSVHRQTGGNPLFVVELVRSTGRSEGGPSDIDAGLARVPERVAELARRRVDALGNEAADALCIAAVIGGDFDAGVLQRLCGVTPVELIDLLDRAVAARILLRDTAGARYRFAHPLLRDALYARLPAGRRMTLHGAVGDALSLAAGTDVAVVAHHLELAAPVGWAARAVDSLRAAGLSARRNAAPLEAASYFRRAIDALRYLARPDDETACGLLLNLGEALSRAGALDAARSTFEEALARARALGAPSLLGAAALGLAGPVGVAGVVDAGKCAVLEEALGRLGSADDALAVRLMSRLAIELYYTSERDRRAALSGQAVSMARRLEDPSALAYALHGRHYGFFRAENVTDRLAVATEMLQLARRLGDRELELFAHHWRVVDLMELGDVTAADRDIAEHARLSATLRQPFHQWMTSAMRTARSMLDSEYVTTERLAQRTLELGQEAQVDDALQYFAVPMWVLAREQGWSAEIEPLAIAFAEEFPTIPAWQCAVELIRCDSGRAPEARPSFLRLCANRCAAVPQDSHWLMTIAVLGEICVALGDCATAPMLYELLAPYAGRMVTGGFTTVPYYTVSRFLGLLAACLERWTDAETHQRSALAEHEAVGSALLAATSRVDLAGALAAREGADKAEIAALLRDASATAERVGAPRLLASARAVARLAGIPEAAGV